MLYLNNAATSFPKPPEVVAAVVQSLTNAPQDPGRTQTHSNPLATCRQAVGALFGLSVDASSRVALLPSATYALNTVILGSLTRGDHAIASCCNHNSVLRPLAHLEKHTGVQVTYLGCDSAGTIDLEQLTGAFCPATKLVAVTQASNVTGTIQPVEQVAKLCAERSVTLLVDASQTAGCVPLNITGLPGRVFVATTAHKGLLGPTGLGVLFVPDAGLGQMVFGGTGVQSATEEHPQELPLRHEAGTPNLVGIAGLEAGARWVKSQGVAALGEQRQLFVQRLRCGLQKIADVEVMDLGNDDGRVGIVSFRIRGWRPEELSFALSSSFGIETRAGLFCAPRMHHALGTFPDGLVRASAGALTQPQDADPLVDALERLGP